MKLNENQKLFSDIIISLLEQMYDMHNGTLSELCDPVRNANKELIINELSRVMFNYNISNNCVNISKVQQMKLYKELCNKINGMFNSEFNTEKNCISNILDDVSKDSYYINSYVTSIGIDYTLKPVEGSVLKNIINHKIDDKLWSDFLWEDKKTLRKDLKFQVKKFLNGETNVNEISKIIQDKYKNNKYITTRLVNHNIAIVQESTNDVWRENHNIKTVLYMGTLDFKICSKCSQYDGESYNSDDRPIELPQHIGCRCTYVNMPSADWRPKIRLDNETKEKVNWQSYEEWRKGNIDNKIKNDIINDKKWLKSEFSSKKKFDKHIEKHLKEYGDISEKEYLEVARKILAEPLSKDVEGFISKEGFLFKYKKSTNDFAIGRPDGYISTLYKPIKGYNQWLEEIEKYKGSDD
ncbi:phage head morphogenesis protein [Clostridium botulinum]|nr:phage head morphogenesis protein [Clostridium botulinum]NFO54849.1 phage head morphogenesis protein [Clostridium botulinum]